MTDKQLPSELAERIARDLELHLDPYFRLNRDAHLQIIAIIDRHLPRRQPIETAPKSVSVLLGSEECEIIGTGYAEFIDTLCTEGHKPTRWQPFPTPPDAVKPAAAQPVDAEQQAGELFVEALRDCALVAEPNGPIVNSLIAALRRRNK